MLSHRLSNVEDQGKDDYRAAMYTITSNYQKQEGHMEQETIKIWQSKNTKFSPMAAMTVTLT
jgi:hypothetical protein